MQYPKASTEDLTAPASKFRVLGVVVEGDSADIYVIGDFASFAVAAQAAREKAGVGSPVYIYDDQAQLIARHGSWH